MTPLDRDLLRRAAEQRIIQAVLYAMREGCFWRVPEPQPGWSVRRLIRWGALRNLHSAVAELNRVDKTHA